MLIVDPSILGFKGMIQKFKVTTIDMNEYGARDIDREHCFLIVWLFLAYRAVIHNGGFVRGWNGAFILQNCPFTC